MRKCSATVAYVYARARQLEGTYPQDAGSFIITGMRVMFGWGSILDEAWPDAGPYAPIPPGLDSVAKAHRTQLYFRVQDLGDVRRCVAMGHQLVSIAVPVTHDWFSAPEGRIPLPRRGTPIIANHALCIHGYDNGTRLLNFNNSWGREWGDDGRGTISYAYFDRHLQEAWSTEFLGKPIERDTDQLRPGINELSWGRWSPLGLVHGIELYDADADERLAWALVLENRGRLEFQDLFVKPAYRRAGYATGLIRQIARLARTRQLPMVLPVHPVDVRLFEDPVRKLARTIGVSLEPAKRPWVALVGRYAG